MKLFLKWSNFQEERRSNSLLNYRSSWKPSGHSDLAGGPLAGAAVQPKELSFKWFVLQVLFPLLDKVAIESGLASTEKSGDSLLIHHSRNTEQKQWSETQVLTISGVARVFVTKRSLLHTLGDFPKAWRLLLEHIEKLSLSATQEVRVKSSST